MAGRWVPVGTVYMIFVLWIVAVIVSRSSCMSLGAGDRHRSELESPVSGDPAVSVACDEGSDLC